MRRELTTASALGGPRWRIAYHLGLVEEAAGQLEAARKFYGEEPRLRAGAGAAQRAAGEERVIVFITS